MTTRGALRVYVGMAAGVGKTYAMLEDAHARIAAGEDVVIGWLEPHGRPDTSALADGIEVIRPRSVSHRGITLLELDTEAVCARAPAIALVDELAHTNAPGSATERRADDVAHILNSGIGVFSTMNIQHLESLNDHIQELTGVRVRETVPDQVLLDADEVILVDLPPEVLRQRLRTGKVYPGPRVDAALLNFFTEANLTTLREVALREVAGAVGARLRPRPLSGEPAPTARTDARLLVITHPKVGAQRLMRVAWRVGRLLGAEVEVICPMPPRGPDGARQHRLMRDLAATLGAHIREVPEPELIPTVLQLAAGERVTHIALEMPRAKGLLRRVHNGVLERLIAAVEGVDIILIGSPPRPGARDG